MNKNIKVSKNYTIQQYIDARNKNDSNIIASLLDERLQTRYFDPISKLNQDSNNNIGFGFSITVLICSLIEFLASCRKGQFYLHKEDDSFKSNYNYISSRDIFIDFLRKNKPFKSEFNSNSSNNKYSDIAIEFYSEVRCPLIHSASTGKDWAIIANIDDYQIKYNKDWTTKIISYDSVRRVNNINRTIFVEKLKEYKNTYINSVKSDEKTFNNLILVLDHLFDNK